MRFSVDWYTSRRSASQAKYASSIHVDRSTLGFVATTAKVVENTDVGFCRHLLLFAAAWCRRGVASAGSTVPN
jgi:hypothetical protein